MDLKKEYEDIKAYGSSDFFKATPGKYNIVIIGEPQPTEYDDGAGHITEQVLLNIQIDQKDYKWSVSKGKTTTSLYGQIVKLSSTNNFKTNGLKFTLLVRNTGSKNDYIIEVALHIDST